MVTSVEKLKKEIEKLLGKYPKEDLKIEGKSYSMYVFNENKSLNIFEGFLFKEISDKQELKDLLNYRYSPGYTVRIGIYIYNGDLIIKDYLTKKQIRKTISKINKLFLKKFIKALEKPKKEENISALFDRTDVIEEFYILYRKSREFLLKKIKGIPEGEKRKEFIDNFMMQMLTLWYLQEKGFFNKDKKYLINAFKEYKNKGFESFYEFLNYLFDRISGSSDEQYVKDEKIGECIVIGPAIFLNGEEQKRKEIEIPDECFYQEGLTEELINLSPRGNRRTLRDSDINFNIPLLNLFESRDWTEGNIDEFVLGAIFEKLMNYDDRKQTGAYYTPEEITRYICENTIKPYLLDRINERFNNEFESLEEAIEEGKYDVLEYLFKQLQDIKILDPACGSGHFLEDAIEVLVDIYEKLWQKAKKLNLKGKFVIKAANEKGEIEDIDLVEITDEEKFTLLVKFFIILSRNIYGVDINPAAIKVARARLFLTLAKHFKAELEKDVFIRFPNVHFNLREGNSLIGYVELKEEKRSQPKLFDFGTKEEKVSYITKKIQVVTELKEYLERISKSLNLDGNVVEEIEKLNEILSKRKIDREDFEKVLKTKEKLIRILIASLNSKYAKPLNDLLREITDFFNQKLDEKFAEENNIDLEKLKSARSIPWERKMFHWAFEFPEVFLGGRGFDVVIGNPPYGKIKNMEIAREEKEMFSYIYKMFYKKIGSNVDFYKLFLERSIVLAGNSGYYSFLIPIMFWGDKDSFELRRLYFNNCINKILHFPLETTIRLFKQVINYEVSIFVLKKKNMENENYMFLVLPYIKIEEIENLNSARSIKLDKDYIQKSSKLWRLPLFKSDEEKEIIHHLSKFKTFGDYMDGKPLGWIFDGKLHETNDRQFLSSEPTGELAVASNHIKAWFVDLEPKEEEKRWIKNGNKFRQRKLREPIMGARTVGELMEFSPKIVGREMANRGEKRKFHFSILFGKYIITNSVRVIILNKKMHKEKYYYILLALLNSAILDWRFQRYSLTYHIKPYEIEELPIIDLDSPDVNLLVPLAKYMLFLKQYQNYFARKDRHLQYIIDYFDNLIDCLVYELYLGDVVKIPIKQFAEDKLEDIKLPDNLLEIPQEEREKTLEKIKNVFQKLENDKQLNENLYLIKLHPWVKAIYTSLER